MNKASVFGLASLCTVITVYVLLNLLWWSRSTGPTNAGKTQAMKQQHKIAILIPFLGDGPESIPPYLNLFVAGAAGSASLVDFLLIHDGVLNDFHTPLPSNVKFIDLGSTKAMMQSFTRVVDRRAADDLALDSIDLLVKILGTHVPRYPYVLVEFKPALGHIFADYIQGYTHWGYSDLDIVFGDLATWITPQELDDYDIVTYGFGDADRVYLRGQFTIHRNDAVTINQLWRDCHYLSYMDQRFADILTGKSKMHFESAEACYSDKVLKRTDVRVKVATKAFTDVLSHDVVHTHGMYLQARGDKSVLYKPLDAAHGKAIAKLDRNWSEHYDITQVEFGRRFSIEWLNDPNVTCMYWVRELYRSTLCISGADARDTIFLEEGKLWRQNYETSNLPTGITSAPFFHFQEWKRFYRYNQNAMVDGESTWVLTKEGALPLPNLFNNRVPSPLGIHPSQWQGHRDQLPHHPYCILPRRRKFPPVPPAPGCDIMISWRNSERVELVLLAPGWKHVDVEFDVTLVLTLQITAQQAAQQLEATLDLAIMNIQVWQGQPCVLVVHIAGATKSITERARSILKRINHKRCLVALVAHSQTKYGSRKALLNMATDAAPTRWVLSGIELERGLLVSLETAAFCQRQAQIQGSGRGQVLILPQLATTGTSIESLLSADALLREKKEHAELVRLPSDFEKGSCESDDSDNSLFTLVDELWWESTELQLNGISSTGSDEAVSNTARSLSEIEETFLHSLAMVEEARVDNSPVLLIDNAGPRQGIWASTMVRHVEEFVGKECYNGFHLAQLVALGYEFQVLSGAFVASTRASRQVALALTNKDTLGASRCDGCIMFQEEDEGIMSAIIEDERRRVSKAAILWAEEE